MSAKIHPTAVVGDAVELADDVVVGPYCVLTGKISIAAGTVLLHQVYARGPLTVGRNNRVYPNVTLGYDPQDWSFDPNVDGAGTVIGEGGSGGALAVGVGNRVLMLEHSVYSVISPEGCAAILWRDRAEGPKAAEALKITAADCVRLGVADAMVPEPKGGAHRNVGETVANLGSALRTHLDELLKMSPEEVKADRYARFRRLGAVIEGQVEDK